MQLDACIDPRGVGGSLDIWDITVLDMCSSGSGISDVLLSPKSAGEADLLPEWMTSCMVVNPFSRQVLREGFPAKRQAKWQFT